jgi:hypothetical protein
METVRFFDVDSGTVVTIPASELAAGAVQARVEGIDGVVWLLPDKLKPGEVTHPPFDEGVRAYIRQIREAFAEHRPLSFEEWEDGFRRDSDPLQEIALWCHAAEVYAAFAAGEPAAERRKDVYRCVVTCMNASPDTVWRVFQPRALSRPEAEQVVNRFYGRGAEPGD